MTPICPYHNVLMKVGRLIDRGFRQLFYCPICGHTKVVLTTGEDNEPPQQIQMWEQFENQKA